MTRVGAGTSRAGAKEGAEKKRRREEAAAGKEKKDRQHSGANTDVARASRSDQVLDGKPAG